MVLSNLQRITDLNVILTLLSQIFLITHLEIHLKPNSYVPNDSLIYLQCHAANRECSQNFSYENNLQIIQTECSFRVIWSLIMFSKL